MCFVRFSFVVLVVVATCTPGCEPSRQPLLMWSNTTDLKTALRQHLNERGQLRALSSANPTNDAHRCIELGDLRLISSRPTFPTFPGTPEDDLVYALRRRFGFKRIAETEALSTNAEFEAHRQKYEENFNRCIYDFALTRSNEIVTSHSGLDPQFPFKRNK
jgi:hypothetical protein